MISTFCRQLSSDTKPCACVIERNMLVYMVGHGVMPYTPHGTTLCGEKSLITVKNYFGKKHNFLSSVTLT